MNRLRALLVAAACTCLLGVPAAAGAATADGTVVSDQPAIRVERVDLAPDGEGRLTVSVAGLPVGTALDAQDFTLVENGAVVGDVRLGGDDDESATVRPAVVLAVDTSGSTEGAPLSAAVEAGRSLVEELEAAGVVTALVEFGPQVTVHARFEDPPGTVTTELAALSADGATLLYDAVARGTRLLAGHEGPRDLVVFSDGVDNGSATDLATVRELATEAEVRVTSVALETEDFDLAPLQAIASATGGSLIPVTDPGDLTAAFAGVAADLTTRFVLEWTSEPVPVPPSELSLEVRLDADEVAATDQVVVFNPRVPAITDPVPYRPAGPPVPLLGSSTGLVVATGATFLAVLLIAGLVLSGAGERRRREHLAERLQSWDGVGEAPDEAVVAAASLSERAADAMERLPQPKGLQQRLFQLLERADWPMRPSEFQLVTMATVVGGFLVPLILLGSVPVAVVGLLLGAVGPYVTLRVAVGRRVRAFEDQLPAVLSLLAGALRAGHSFHTALEGTIRETDEPAHSELRRAAVEHRLGRPVAVALRGVADRMESTDLRWVVTAIAIQQEVGGNLAELLDNVAGTLRDRASLARTVRALSAEGKLSAWIIGLMPFAMFVLLMIINPTYMSVLYETGVGRAMLAVAGLLLAAGSVWLRNIVQPKF